VVQRPTQINAFEFVVLAGRRATQLSRGCLPRVIGSDKVAVTAQMEVAEGKVSRASAASISEPAASHSPDAVDGHLAKPPVGTTGSEA
jgi:DNA-directed RNA polymerase subunit K/omega